MQVHKFVRSMASCAGVAAVALASFSNAEPPDDSVSNSGFSRVRIPHSDVCTRHYVDPVRGMDTNSGLFGSPLRTLRMAMTRAGMTPGADTIILLPGEYSPQGSGDFWPLRVLERVSIQGTNVLNTVLRDTTNSLVFLEFVPTSATSYDETVIDGVTFAGGAVHLDIKDGLANRKVVRSNPTVANCFLLDAAYTSISMTNPQGLLGFLPTTGHDLNMDLLVEHRPKIINCTFRLNGIGIFNGSKAFSPVQSTRAASEPGIVNSLFAGNGFDLEGIDSLQVITSAFDSVNVRGSSTPLRGIVPIPVFVPAGRPLFFDMGIPATTALDQRLVPYMMGAANPAIDTGSLGLLWPNGTVGQTLFPCSINIRDTDGEGYGNPRIERMAIDIGADESGQLQIAGYIRGTTDFTGPNGTNNVASFWGNPFPPFATAPFTGTTFFALLDTAAVVTPWTTWFPVQVDGARAITTTAPTVLPPFGTQLVSAPAGSSIDFAFTTPTVPVPVPMPQAGATPWLFSAQLLPWQVGGSVGVLSNQQTFFVNP